MKTFKTGSVARRLGVAPTLLRVWETRYGLVEPVRGPGGQRVYSEDDVEILSCVCRLVERGFAVGEVAAWSRDDIREVLRRETRLEPARDARIASPTVEALLTLDQEGVIKVASPSVEAILGWPHGLLVGQPVWGLLGNVPATFERFVVDPARGATHFTICLWARRRDGHVMPVRVACSRRRRVADGTSVTIALSPLFGAGEPTLSPLIDTVDFGGLVAFRGTTERMLQHVATTSVEVHHAALARVWTYDAAAGELRLVASAGLSQRVGASPRATIKLASYRYKVGSVARSGVPFVHHGLAGDPDFDGVWVRRERLESAAVFPIVVDGVLAAVTAEFFTERLGPEMVNRLQASASLCASWLRARRRGGKATCS